MFRHTVINVVEILIINIEPLEENGQFSHWGEMSCGDDDCAIGVHGTVP